VYSIQRFLAVGIGGQWFGIWRNNLLLQSDLVQALILFPFSATELLQVIKHW